VDARAGARAGAVDRLTGEHRVRRGSDQEDGYPAQWMR